MNAPERAEELRILLNYHSDLYYNQNSSVLSDAEYDALMQELKQIETENPELIRPDSPTQKVGGSAKRTAGVLIPHRVPMLSMQDLFTKEEVDHFIEECQEKLGSQTTFIVETKIDGLSMALRYENGCLVTAITRGDGRNLGEDVTENAKVIQDVATKLKDPVPYLEVRGEVYMTYEAFDAVNKQQELLGKKSFANPRNCAAGTLRQLDSHVTKQRNLSFFVFNIQDMQGMSLKTHAEAYAYLKQNGVNVIDTFFVCEGKESVWESIGRIGKLRGILPYQIDGAVIKVNHLEARKQLRDTAKNAGYQVAYKYPPERKETKLLNIELSVGRTGKITPTAVFEPIQLCGTTVSRATLHNQDFINSLGICIGSTLLIEKSGEVIPKCVQEIREKRPPHAVPFQIPPICPACGSPAVREDTADLKCVNLNCPAQLERLIYHFVGRDAMDIKGFGAVYVHDLIEQGYLSDVADIFMLHQYRDTLIQAGIIGKEKNTDKLLATIEKAKSNPPQKLLTGLGIPNVGKSAAKALIQQFGSLDHLMEADETELTAVLDIGQITAHCIHVFFKQEKNRKILEKLREAGVKMEQDTVSIDSEKQTLSGKTIVITGTLPNRSRDEVSALIEQHGGKVTGSVSSKTTYLLAGEDAGSKLDKANRLHVPVISFDELLAMIET